MLHVGVELGVFQTRHAELQRQLQEAYVRRIRQPRAMRGGAAVHADLTVSTGQEIHAPLRYASHDRLHDRVIERAQQGGLNYVRFRFAAGAAEQFA